MDARRWNGQSRFLLVLLMLGLAVWSHTDVAYADAELFGRSIAEAHASAVVGVEAVTVDGTVRVRFETASLDRIVGFFLYRRDTVGDTYIKVNHEMIPAVVGAEAGSSLEIRDETAPAARRLNYVLVSVGPDGERLHGPFRVDVGSSLPQELHRRAAGRKRRDADVAPIDALQSLQGADNRMAATGLRTNRSNRKGRTKSELPRVRMEVGESGLYYVSGTDLASLTTTSRRRIRRLIRKGKMRLVSGGADVSWIRASRGSGLFFYGSASSSPFSEQNVYFLEKGRGQSVELIDGGAPALGSVTVSQVSERFEMDVMPVTFLASAVPDDFYYWSALYSGHAEYGSVVHEFEIDERATLTGTASIGLEMLGATSTPADPEHHAEVLVNGAFVGTATWDGALPHLPVIEFPGEFLQAGVNEVTITGIKLGGVPYSTFLLDGFDISYDRSNRPVDDSVDLAVDAGFVTVGDFTSTDVLVLDVTDPVSVKRIANVTVEQTAGGFGVSFLSHQEASRFLAVSRQSARSPLSMEAVSSSALLAESTGAEYVVIAPAELRSAAEDLATYRSGQGLSVLVADLEEIFDHFGTGLPAPEALRTFLQHAYTTWQIQPRFVVLAGRGTFDHLDAEGLGENLLPAFMASTPYGYFAWDGYYADLVGDDDSPDVALGRIPAASNDELQQYVDKLISNESFGIGVEPDDLILLADNADAGGNYPVTSDELQAWVPVTTEIERIYLSEQYVTQARASLVQALSTGASWVNYVGHGVVDRLASEGLLRVADVPLIPVGGRLPFVSAMACSVGRFEVPAWTSLAEALVLDPNGGAAAVFSASGQSLNFEAKMINQSLFDAVYTTEVQTVGEGVVHALRSYAEEGNLDFMKRIYNLLGDPAFRIR